MTWAKVLEALVSPSVFAAFIVLIGVAVTAIVTMHVSRKNRLSAEKSVLDRLDFERRQTDSERLLDDKREHYLKCMDVLIAVRSTYGLESKRSGFDRAEKLKRASSEMDELTSRGLLICEPGVHQLFIRTYNGESRLARWHREGVDHESDDWVVEHAEAHHAFLEFKQRASDDLYGRPLSSVAPKLTEKVPREQILKRHRRRLDLRSGSRTPSFFGSRVDGAPKAIETGRKVSSGDNGTPGDAESGEQVPIPDAEQSGLQQPTL